MTEEAYVSDVKSGNTESFSALVNLYYDKVFFHCIKLMKNEHDAADVTQNTFVKAFTNINRLGKINSFSSWLFSICNNEIKMFYRKSKCRFLPNNKSNDINYNELYSAIDTLDEKYRNLILLKYFSAFSSKEISILSGIKENLIKSRLYEARKQIKEMLFDKSLIIKSPYNKNRRLLIMEVIKLLDLGSRVVPCMSLWGQKELLRCAKEEKKFSEDILSELSKIKDGNDFVLECKGCLSYEDFIRIIMCCDDDIFYRLNGQDFKTWRHCNDSELLNDFISHMNTGGYIDSVEMILYVPSIIDTVNWYEKHLGWNGDKSQEDETYGYSQVRIYNNDVANLMNSNFKGFHLRKSCGKDETTKGHCFVMVSSLETLYERIKNSGWEKVSEIYIPGWGTKQFMVEDLNGFVMEFSEWICAENK